MRWGFFSRGERIHLCLKYSKRLQVSCLSNSLESNIVYAQTDLWNGRFIGKTSHLPCLDSTSVFRNVYSRRYPGRFCGFWLDISHRQSADGSDQTTFIENFKLSIRMITVEGNRTVSPPTRRTSSTNSKWCGVFEIIDASETLHHTRETRKFCNDTSYRTLQSHLPWRWSTVALCRYCVKPNSGDDFCSTSQAASWSVRLNVWLRGASSLESRQLICGWQNAIQVRLM